MNTLTYIGSIAVARLWAQARAKEPTVAYANPRSLKPTKRRHVPGSW